MATERPWRPVQQITLGDGAALNFADRLVSLTITDESGDFTDILEIVLQDADGKLKAPVTGAALWPRLGYAEGKLYEFDVFTVNRVSRSRAAATGRIMTIEARAADMSSKLKAGKCRSFENISLGALVRQLASENGLTPEVASEFDSLELGTFVQTSQSDMDVMNTLARRFGATWKPVGNRLVFAVKGKGTKASGEGWDAIPIRETDVQAWDWATEDRPVFSSVEARWFNAETGRDEFVTAGGGDTADQLLGQYKSKAEAQAAADARWAELSRRRAVMHLVLVGDPRFGAERPLDLSGFGGEADGRWLVEQAVHKVEAGRFTTSLTLKMPNERASQS